MDHRHLLAPTGRTAHNYYSRPLVTNNCSKSILGAEGRTQFSFPQASRVAKPISSISLFRFGTRVCTHLRGLRKRRRQTTSGKFVGFYSTLARACNVPSLDGHICALGLSSCQSKYEIAEQRLATGKFSPSQFRNPIKNRHCITT